MTDRNWDAELAKIDKQLSSISDDQLAADKRAAAVARPGAVPAAASAGRAPAAAPGNVVPTAKSQGTWRGWVQALVAVSAAAGLWFWPWPAQCGVPLVGFVGATALVSMLGLWSAVGTWRHRLGAAHILSLVVVLWGIVLGAREVLPRVGYAVPNAVRGSNWRCEVPSAPINTTPPVVTPPAATPPTGPVTATPPTGTPPP